MIDYTNICVCGFETYHLRLMDAKASAHFHVNEVCEHERPEVYIDRNKDNEIDESFKSIIVLPRKMCRHHDLPVKDGNFCPKCHADLDRNKMPI
jgi:hypothetical protein